MKEYEGLTFEEFRENDVDAFTAIMKRAFDEDTRRHLNKPEGGPPGYDNGDFLREYGLNEKSQACKVSKGSIPIGMFIVWINENKENYLGVIFVDPLFQDQGVGLKIWRYIESSYPDTIVWKTGTRGFSKRNHNFYVNKCGFKIVKIENPGDLNEEGYLMEKEMKSPSFGPAS